MEKLFIIIITLGVAVFISLPFIARKSRQGADSDEHGDEPLNPVLEKLAHLRLERDSLLAAIKEIEFDYSLGKLSVDDFDELLEQYRVQAALASKEIDDVERGVGLSTTALDSEIEREVASSRIATKPRAKDDADEIEGQILLARESRVVAACPECASVYKPEDRFCSKCGAKVNERALSQSR
ncbi:MAG: zinc ribbon domain-containing protein [Deltaproteobacteria bacterium]